VFVKMKRLLGTNACSSQPATIHNKSARIWFPDIRVAWRNMGSRYDVAKVNRMKMRVRTVSA
jgi:hypothetical protein